MATQVTLTIPDKVYSYAQELATRQQQNVQAILVYQIIKSMMPVVDESDPPTLLQDEDVAYEKKAYSTMHPQLWVQYPGQHVAIHGGKLVDHDEDGIALSRRIYARYPDEFVLIKKVESKPERTMTFRSPRFIKEKTT